MLTTYQIVTEIKNQYMSSEDLGRIVEAVAYKLKENEMPDISSAAHDIAKALLDEED